MEKWLRKRTHMPTTEPHLTHPDLHNRFFITGLCTSGPFSLLSCKPHQSTDAVTPHYLTQTIFTFVMSKNHRKSRHIRSSENLCRRDVCGRWASQVKRWRKLMSKPRLDFDSWLAPFCGFILRGFTWNFPPKKNTITVRKMIIALVFTCRLFHLYTSSQQQAT